MIIDEEIIRYIMNDFSHLLTEKEKLALRHLTSLEHLGTVDENDSKLAIFKKNNWLTNDQEALHLLKDGYRPFELNVVSRILSESSDKVFFNRCPKCEGLARTSSAKQCRHCGYSWHDKPVA